MRIALVSEFFYPTLGGVQEHLYNLAKQFSKKGHTVRIVTPRIFTRKKFKDWWPADLSPEVYQPVGHSLPFFINGSRGRLCVGLGLKQKISRLLSPENFDVVHMHAPLSGTLPILAAHYCSTHLVGTFHTSFPGSKSLDLFKGMAQRQIDKFEKILGVSPISIESILKFVNLEAEILPNGIDTEYFRPRGPGEKKLPGLDDDRLNILFVGRPDVRNGLDTLILAFGKVLKKHPKLRLVVAGGGSEMQRYEDMAAYLPKEAVRFLGPVRDERNRVYQSGDIHVFGVEKATFSITVLEGMSSGLPVVTTPFEGHRSLGVVGTHFTVTPFGDADALATELDRLILNPAERKRLAENARQHSLRFDWSLVAERLLEIYEELQSGRERSGTSRTRQHFLSSLDSPTQALDF